MKYWDRGWNPIIGCRRCSEGCENCLSLVSSKKRNPEFKEGQIFLNTKVFERPIGQDGEFICVGSQSDIFIEDATDEVLDTIFCYMESNEQKQKYFVCTKRAERMLDYLQRRELKKKYIFAISAENQKNLDKRWESLKQVPYPIALVLEPLLEDVKLTDEMIDAVSWIVIGEETGEKARQTPKDAIKNLIKSVDKRAPIFCTSKDSEYHENPMS